MMELSRGAIIGIPIAVALLLYLLSKRVTRFFDLLANDDARG
jgi:hypothetical protein